TLFGLVLAIGIVVDDAIVIVENAAHHIEKGMTPHDGTVRAMSEVTGPVLGITLVLMAVFLPSAFLGGITGQLYRQFALTIAVTALISAVNALTLTSVQLPDAAALGRTEKVVDRIEQILGETDGVYTWFAIGGFSFVDGGNSSSAAAVFIVFDDWQKRAEHGLSQDAMLGGLNMKF